MRKSIWLVMLFSLINLAIGKDEFYPYDICPGHASAAPFVVSSIESFSSPQRGEIDVIFNQRTQRFFVVWAEEKGSWTELWGTHFDFDGTQGDSFPVTDDKDVAPLKRSPKLAYNNNSREYLIVFESPRTDGNTIELYSIVVGDDDSPAERPNLLVAETGTRFGDVSVAYHPDIDEYLVATEKIGKSTQEKVMINILRLTGRGFFMKLLLSFSGDQPHISINPNGFFIVSEDPNKEELQATFVQKMGSYSHTTIVITLDSNITLIHPQAAWSPVQNCFVLVYEEGTATGRKLISQNIQMNGTFFRATELKTYIDAQPTFEFYNFDMKYDSLYDNIILSFEEDRTGDNSVSFIQTVMLSAKTHQIWKSIEISDSNNEHQPKVAVSDDSRILFIWSSGPQDAIDNPFSSSSFTSSSSSSSLSSTSSTVLSTSSSDSTPTSWDPTVTETSSNVPNTVGGTKRRKRENKNDDVVMAKFMCGTHYAALSRAEKTEIAAFVVIAALCIVVGVSVFVGLRVKQRPMIEHTRLQSINAELELREQEIQRHQNDN